MTAGLATARLGRTDVEVTTLGLGTAPLGGLFEPVSDADAAAVIEADGWSKARSSGGPAGRHGQLGRS